VALDGLPALAAVPEAVGLAQVVPRSQYQRSGAARAARFRDQYHAALARAGLAARDTNPESGRIRH